MPVWGEKRQSLRGLELGRAVKWVWSGRPLAFGFCLSFPSGRLGVSGRILGKIGKLGFGGCWDITQSAIVRPRGCNEAEISGFWVK